MFAFEYPLAFMLSAQSLNPSTSPLTSTEGHYIDNAGGHYNGSAANHQPCSEDYYWYRLQSAQGQQPLGKTINLDRDPA